MEYFTFYLGIPLFGWYLYYLFPQEVSKKFVSMYSFIAIFYSLHVLLTLAREYSRFLYSFDLISVIFLLYILFSVGRALIRKREGALMVIMGFVIFVLTAINDMLYYSEKSVIGNLSSLGVFIFIFVQAYILSRLSARAFDTVEQMSEN